jgi:hypothetical protein
MRHFRIDIAVMSTHGAARAQRAPRLAVSPLDKGIFPHPANAAYHHQHS